MKMMNDFVDRLVLPVAGTNDKTAFSIDLPIHG